MYIVLNGTASDKTSHVEREDAFWVGVWLFVLHSLLVSLLSLLFLVIGVPLLLVPLPSENRTHLLV